MQKERWNQSTNKYTNSKVNRLFETFIFNKEYGESEMKVVVTN